MDPRTGEVPEEFAEKLVAEDQLPSEEAPKSDWLEDLLKSPAWDHLYKYDATVRTILDMTRSQGKSRAEAIERVALAQSEEKADYLKKLIKKTTEMPLHQL